MSRTKIKIVSDLRNSDSEGLQYFIGTRDEVLPGTDDWPGLGQRPSEPQSRGDDKEKKALEDEWRRTRAGLTADGRFANCKCVVKTGLNFVLITAILNEKVYQETVAQCGDTGEGCREIDSAPVL